MKWGKMENVNNGNAKMGKGEREKMDKIKNA